MYLDETDLLPLSGIQHIAFCERQWALIHLERQWAENVRTVEGKQMHERADDPFITESRGDVVSARAVPIVSHRLGLYGVADVIEFLLLEIGRQGICLKGKGGLWIPRPVEYKRGKEKSDDRDEVQLCAQAMCLEEMLGVSITSGDLFYGMTKHRVNIDFSEELRNRVEELSERMHYYFSNGITPAANEVKHCKLCSLEENCMPGLGSKSQSVKNYIKAQLQSSEEKKG